MQTNWLPIFPLGLVLYPEEELSLHIFETRYRELVAYCLENDAPFAIVLFQEGEMSEIGCTAHINQIVEEYDDGRKDILISGKERIRILDVSEEMSYLTARFDVLIDDSTPVDAKLRERVIAQHIRLLELAGRMPAPTSYQDRANLSYFIAHNAGLTIEQKQEVLEMEGESSRLKFLADHMEKFIPMVEEVEAIRAKVLSNGHFRDFPLNGSEDLSE